jgi:hypothetical protein
MVDEHNQTERVRRAEVEDRVRKLIRKVGSPGPG